MNSIAMDEGRSPSPRGCLRTLRVRHPPNLPSEMRCISSAHFKDVSPERSELRSRLNAGCAEIIPGLLESIHKATSERREYGKGKKAQNLRQLRRK